MEQINIARLTTKQPYQRQSVGIGGADRPERSELAASIAVAYHALCVPSMGEHVLQSTEVHNYIQRVKVPYVPVRQAH